jgi:hypothetical protein
MTESIANDFWILVCFHTRFIRFQTHLYWNHIIISDLYIGIVSWNLQNL